MLVRKQNLAERDRLVVKHIDLVKALAHRLARRLPSQVDVGDLVSVGMLGLLDAAGRYDPALGVPFDAFARRRIHGAMLDALRGLDWAPRSRRRLQRGLEEAIAKLRHELGREPAEAELAKEMSLSPEEFARAVEQVRDLELGNVRELDAKGADGTPLIDLCVDPGEGQDVVLERKELREHLAAALTQLPERERHVLALYYQEELTMSEIGEVIGVCESRVSQLRSLAVTRLRTHMTESLQAPKAA
jgi:RNA polymerase sigma factor for flagellar operon FliA